MVRITKISQKKKIFIFMLMIIGLLLYSQTQGLLFIVGISIVGGIICSSAFFYMAKGIISILQ